MHTIRRLDLPPDHPLQPEPGYAGAFTRATAPGAIPSGTRCRKVNSEKGDATANGTLGVILGSIAFAELAGGMPLYFVEWDDSPRVAVACMAPKVEAAP